MIATIIDQCHRANRQRERNRAAIAMLDEWMRDESGYDYDVWPEVELTIQSNPIRLRDEERNR